MASREVSNPVRANVCGSGKEHGRLVVRAAMVEHVVDAHGLETLSIRAPIFGSDYGR